MAERSQAVPCSINLKATAKPNRRLVLLFCTGRLQLTDREFEVVVAVRESTLTKSPKGASVRVVCGDVSTG